MKRTVWLLACSALAAACGSSAAPAPKEPSAPLAADSAPDLPPSSPAVTAAAVEPVSVPRAAPQFADSPLTALAGELIQIVEATLAGEPLPEVSFPIERREAGDRLVSGDTDDLKPPFDFIAFGMELEVSLGPAAISAPSGDADPQQGLKLMLLLTRHGLRVIELKATGVGRGIAAPAWLPLDGLAAEILADLRSDQMQRWWLGDAEKQLLGPQLAAELARNEPKPKHVQRAREHAAHWPRAQGFMLDDLALVAKDAAGQLSAFKMEFESGPKPELDAHPIVRVKRVKAD